MCGIAGVVGIELQEASEPVLGRMLRSIVHRGPDAEGALVLPRVAIGSRRLSIIDLPGGNQPLWNEAETVGVVFNGEIYNFPALRRELEALGHRFRTASDTEVIVHAYEAWGENFLQHLQGMFAFALVELPNGRAGRCAKVLLARDRFGIKPLYYAVVDGHFYFASEVRALIAAGCVPARISAEALPSYLLFGSVAEPCTFVEHVFSLPPGHAISLRPGESVRSVEPKSYWTIENSHRKIETPGANAPSASAPAARVRSLLQEAVSTHLVADVPVGVFLSSGIDSTAIATLASRAQGGIHTFTVAFPETEFSEAEIARQTANSLGAHHTEISISDQELTRRIDEAIAAFDEPTADAVNTYFVSWAAKQAGLKVALSGLGSDELFGGYTQFRTTRQVARLAAVGRSLPVRLRSFFADQPRFMNSRRWSRDGLRKALAAFRDPDAFPHPYFFTRALFTPHAVASCMNGAALDWKSMVWSRWMASAVQQSRRMDEFTAVSWLELRSYLLDTLLRDTDAVSMAHSLEVRVPFLDSSLVEYVLSLPQSAKQAENRAKPLLIDALGDLLPEPVLAQPKRTFTFPWQVWLHGKLGERVAEGLHDWAPELEPHIGPQFAVGVWTDFLAGRTSWSRPWSLYVLNEWTKRNFRRHSSDAGRRQSLGATASA
jgi:asparagine synthase (glutamine-hydrolysing)